jgi:hypothetical protein
VIHRWEALSPFVQGGIALPPSSVVLFFVNLGPFHQPVWRSVLYGIFEGGVVTMMLLIATATEKSKRNPTPPQPSPPRGEGD